MSDGRVSPTGISGGYYYGNLPGPLVVGTQSQQSLVTGTQEVTPVTPPSAHVPYAIPHSTSAPGIQEGSGYIAYPGRGGDHGAGGPGPQDYYRNSELFLPQGSRA